MFTKQEKHLGHTFSTFPWQIKLRDIFPDQDCADVNFKNLIYLRKIDAQTATF